MAARPTTVACFTTGLLLLLAHVHDLEASGDTKAEQRTVVMKATVEKLSDIFDYGSRRLYLRPSGSFYAPFDEKGAEQVLENFIRWLRPGSIIILRIPNRDSTQVARGEDGHGNCQCTVRRPAIEKTGESRLHH